MSHPYSSNKSSDVAKRRASSMCKAEGGAVIGTYATGGAVQAFARGGKTELGIPGGKGKRGGKGKKKGSTQINIAIVGGGDKSPNPAGAAPSADVPPPGGGLPPMPPPGAGGGSPMGGPPMAPMAPPPALTGDKPRGGMPGMMNRGGKVKMTGGADTGVGRLEKAKAQKG